MPNLTAIDHTVNIQDPSSSFYWKWKQYKPHILEILFFIYEHHMWNVDLWKAGMKEQEAVEEPQSPS